MLFTKLERYLLKNQAKPFVLNALAEKKQQNHTDSDSSEFEPINLRNVDPSPFYDSLLAGALH